MLSYPGANNEYECAVLAFRNQIKAGLTSEVPVNESVQKFIVDFGDGGKALGFTSLSAAEVISRRDRNQEPERNSLLFTNSSKSFGCRMTVKCLL